MKTKIQIINESNNPLPLYATDGSSGLDLYAALEKPAHIGPLERVMIPTGIRIALIPGLEAQVRPRSGLAAKKGLTVLNSPGTIDSDYRGEVRVILVNLSNESVELKPGERIAQMVVAKYERVEWQEVDKLNETKRGEGGFGSTGQK